MTKNNATAIAHHAIHTSDIEALIAFITERNERAVASRGVGTNWANVGDVARIKEALLEVACITEYTPNESEAVIRERVMLEAFGTLGRRAAAADNKAHAEKMALLGRVAVTCDIKAVRPIDTNTIPTCCNEHMTNPNSQRGCR